MPIGREIATPVEDLDGVPPIDLGPGMTHEEQMRKALHVALHVSDNAAMLWDRLACSGCDDKALAGHVHVEFVAGRSQPSDKYAVDVDPPRFWLGKRQGRATLSGPKLLAKVREVMQVPKTGVKARPTAPTPSAEDLESDAELLRPLPTATHIERLGLPYAWRNKLIGHGITTVEQLQALGQGERSLVDELAKIKGVSREMATKIAEQLQDALAS